MMPRPLGRTRDYYSRRATDEREFTVQAGEDAHREAHLAIAKRYEKCAELYQIPWSLTHTGDSQIGKDVIQHRELWEVAMASAIGLRGDYDGAGLRRLPRLSGHANQVRRLLTLGIIYDGGARHEAARVGGVGLQTVRDWVLRFNAQGPDGSLDGKAPGPSPVLGPEHKRALAEVLEQAPIPASHGVVRWRIVDLIQWLFDE